MEVQVDRSQLYTNGEWILGKIFLDPQIVGVTEIVAKLSGVQLRIKNVGQPKMRYARELYSHTKRISVMATSPTDFKTGNKVFDFALQFPELLDCWFKKVPASFSDTVNGSQFEIRHTITIKAMRYCISIDSLEKTIVLQFMPSASIELLHEPNIVYHEKFSGHYPFSANISIPQYLAQNYAHNKLGFELLDCDNGSLEAGELKWTLIAHDNVKKKSFNFLYDHGGTEILSDSNISKVLEKKHTVVLRNFRIDKLSPNYSMCGVGLNYTLNVSVRIWNTKLGTHHDVSVSKPVEILPTLLYKSTYYDFAELDEIEALLRIRKFGLITYSN